MAAGNAVWGIDVGQCGIKAIKLRNAEDGKVEVVAFDMIEHGKILSQPDADADEIIHAALEKFTSRNEWQGDQFVVGVPGQQTFARFCKMPPVDQKKIPDLVRFEASQQIPFDLDNVVWDYQTFTAEDSPDLEVGIFAMRKDLIRKHLDYFSDVGITPTTVQATPSALYNFCRFDRLGNDEHSGAIVVINVGAQNTDLVIVEPNSAWTRNIPLGGNSFTEALVRAFKLSFSKAESLKRTAATSKYARQIFQAMRPVFAELVAEIQRSIGFYSSTHRNVELKHVLALGNAFRLPGLQKYLENNLTIPGGVHKLEKFNQVVPSATINAPEFTENILTFAASYGLALQGLGVARIRANLLPGDLARIAVWKKKRPFFIATAACLGLVAILPWTRYMLDNQALASTQALEDQRVTQQYINEAKVFQTRFAEVQTNTAEKENNIKQLLDLQKDKCLVPQILALVHEAMPDPNPVIAGIHDLEQLKDLAESEGLPPRAERRQLLIDSLSIEFVPDIDGFELPAGGGGGGARQTGPMPGGLGATGFSVAGMSGRRAGGTVNVGMGGSVNLGMPGQAGQGQAGFHVRIVGRLLYGNTQGEAISFLTDEYYRNLRDLTAQPGRGFYIPDDDPQDKTKHNISRPVPGRLGGKSKHRTGAGTIMAGSSTESSGLEDPVTKEDMGNDWSIGFSFKVKLGEKPQTQEPAPKPGN